MKRINAAITLLLLLSGSTAYAHRIDEYLQATIVSLSEGRMEASMRLIPGTLVAGSIISAIDMDNDGTFSPTEQRAYAQRVIADLAISLDGHALQPQLTSWGFPQPEQMREGLGEIHIEYAVALPNGNTSRQLILSKQHLSSNSVYLMNVAMPDDHRIHVLAQKRNQQQSIYELDYQQNTTPAATFSARLLTTLGKVQFSSLFHLGMRHIAEGTDHLLFLLTLLLPAPLLLSGSRWAGPASVCDSLGRIFGIVTAFTIGHSVSLTLAALNLVLVPSRPVELLIAASVFVSALHALHPIVPGKEALVAAFFGLIHGLAFAATLDRLGLGHWQGVAGILSFNLGIEAMQIIVVAAILPSLLLLSRTNAYSILRIGGALFAGTASLAWMAERAFAFETLVDAIMSALGRHAVSLSAALLLLSVCCRLLQNFPPSFSTKRTALDRRELTPDSAG